MKSKFFKCVVPIVLCVFLLVFVMGTVSASSSVPSTDSDTFTDSVGISSDIVVNEYGGPIEEVDLDNCSYVDKGSYSVNNNGSSDEISCVGATKTSTKIVANATINMYYGSGKYVVAYLKTSSGKAISGQSVKITIDGRSWTKTTDSNGKVTLQIVTLTPKVYPCTIKFAGTSSYAASSKSINVTVKKWPTVGL